MIEAESGSKLLLFWTILELFWQLKNKGTKRQSFHRANVNEASDLPSLLHDEYI